MFRPTVLLVDDDKLVLDEMKSMIDWKSLGFRIVGSVYNGKRALELYEKLRPDLVVTDIVMPIMDGLELISEIRARSSETYVLIITAFDEFEYAKKALQSGVADYILKTEVSTDSFYQKLISIRQTLDDRRQKLQKWMCMELCDYFLHEFDGLENPAVSQPLKETLAEKYHFYVIAHKQALCKNYAPSTPFSADAAYRKLLEYEQVEIPGGGTAFLAHVDSYAILAVKFARAAEATPNLIRAAGISFLSHMSASSERDMIFFCPTRLSPEEFKRMFYARKKTLDFYLHFPMSEVMDMGGLMEDSVARVKKAFRYPSLSKEESVESVRTHIADHLERLFADHDFDGVDSFFKGFCHHYETVMMNTGLFEASVRVHERKALTEWFTQSYLRCRELFLSGVRAGYSQAVNQAVGLILDHYGDPGLCIDSLSKGVGMSPGHIAGLFKKETGKTINEWLTDVRVDAAVFLLENTNCKVYDIAEKVGYGSSQYFSQIFSKIAITN